MTILGYKTKVESVAIAGAQDFVLRTLLDRQQFHDPEGVAQRRGISSATWPLFGLLWPSGIHLAAHLARRPVCPHERILEIGCGLGLASLVGHKRGARITASDRHPLTEVFLDHNARLNDLSLLKYRHGQWGADAEEIELEDDIAVLSGRYDLIIGSDLLYERDAPEALAAFIDQHAEAAAEAWIVDPNRGHRAAFNRHMAAYGFTLEDDVRLNEPPIGYGRPGSYKGRLLAYRRRISG